jgi:hypothetical protein
MSLYNTNKIRVFNLLKVLILGHLNPGTKPTRPLKTL